MRFRYKYYVYRFLDIQCIEIDSLGSFETNLSLKDAYEYIFQVFNDEDPRGIFVRKEKLV